MLISPIRNIISKIKKELQSVLTVEEGTHSRIIYDVGPLIEATNKTIDLIERQGIPEFVGKPVKITDSVTSDYFNNLSENLYDILSITGKILDELTTMTNETIDEYGTVINKIKPAMEELKRELSDLESQTLEKVTNISIYDHEIKNIDFAKNVKSNNLSSINNTLLLPIIKSTQINPIDYSMSILESQEARNRLDQSIVATEDKSDADTIIGSYFGNIIGKLDGTESFISENEVDLSQLHTANLNTGLEANYYSDMPNDTFRIGVTNKLTSLTRVNFISVDANIIPEIAIRLEDESQPIVPLKNNIWASDMFITDLVVNIEQQKPTKLKYQGIDVYRGDNIIKRHNYFTSLAHKLPDTLEELNNSVKTSTIDVSPSDRLVETDRQGFFKYNIFINQINIRHNTYALNGNWISELIKTDFPIEALELVSDFYIPDETLEYISYWVSFDNIDWYPIKSNEEGVTIFNRNKKSRIVLNEDDNNTDYLFIGEQKQNRGVYLRVRLQSNTSMRSPVLYNLKLRIKVDTNE